MKTITSFLLFTSAIFLFHSASAQTTPTLIKGRIIGQAMEELEGATIFNIHSLDSAKTNSRGFFTIKAMRDDTLIFTYPKYSKDWRIVKRITDHINIIMINRKAIGVPDTTAQYKRAARDDDKLYKILDKGAERNGVWNY